MLTRQLIREKRDAILEIARRYGAHDIQSSAPSRAATPRMRPIWI